MADERTSRDTTKGVGPGVTGASGDLIEGTGGDQGIGGTGESGARAAAGQRPDERQNPAPQDLANADPDDEADGPETLPGSTTGTIGGGGPESVRASQPDAGHPGGRSDVPGGQRAVGPANDGDESGARAHGGSKRAEPQE